MKKLIFSFIALIVLFCFSPYIGAKFIQDETMIHSKDVRRENGGIPFIANHDEVRTIMSATLPSSISCNYLYFSVYESTILYATGNEQNNYPTIYIAIYIDRGSYTEIISKPLYLFEPGSKNKDVLGILLTDGEIPSCYDPLRNYLENINKLTPYNKVRIDVSTSFADGDCRLYYHWELY